MSEETVINQPGTVEINDDPRQPEPPEPNNGEGQQEPEPRPEPGSDEEKKEA